MSSSEQSPRRRGSQLQSYLLSGLLSICLLQLMGEERVLSNVASEDVHFDVIRVVDRLHHPWAFQFLPDNSMLISERRGNLIHWRDGERQAIEGLPEIANVGQGGLLDILIDPDFTNNRSIFFAYSASYDGGVGTRVARASISEDFILEDLTVIFSMNPPGRGGRHFGCRLAWHPDGSLFISIGDRGDQDRAQERDNHHGTLLRVDRDGNAMPDNPFVGEDGVLPEIYSYGHRNAQGLWIDPRDGTVWQNEHGPQGGDTLNRITVGANYGWPIATYGEQYGGGRIGVYPHERDDITNPTLHWTPSIAVSGLTGLTSDAVPAWQNNLFNGALRGMHIRRVVVADDGTIAHQESLLSNDMGRIRAVVQGPDGMLWFCTDERNGGIYRIEVRQD